MGNCWSDRVHLQVSSYRNKDKEKELLQRILQFDFNNGDPLGISIEETLMRMFTNDFGEFITPHVAHIIFMEFK